MTALLVPPAPPPPPARRGHVQVHLTEGRACATGVPVLPTVAPPVRVAVLGRGPALEASPRWTRTSPDDPALDVLVVETADAAHVRRLVRDRPGVAVVVVLPASAPSATLVDALDAGAEVCLRGPGSAELAAHLSAVVRRRSAGRPPVLRTAPAPSPKDPR